MKKIIITFVTVFFYNVAAYSQPSNNSIVQNVKHPNLGALGDVKYSVLKETEFQRMNGTGWILMDGRDINNTDLCKLGNVCKILDARGEFIRGWNQDRIDGDPFQKENNKERTLSDYQDDALQNHTHDSMQTISGSVGADKGYIARGTKDYQIGGTIGKAKVNGAQSSEYETRPKNISLYIYIKVNN